MASVTAGVMSSGPPGPIPATIIFFILAAKLQKIINFAAKYKKDETYHSDYWWTTFGQSQHAEQLALQLAENPVYLATAHVWDEEFRQRVLKHQERRGPQWTNIEEEKFLSRHELTGRVIVIDCVTLWLTNFFFENNEVEQTLEQAKAEFDRFTSQEATFIFVTNEIGSGGVSENAIQRKFTDLEGWMNQYIAAKADEVILMVSGIPLKVK